MAYRAFKVDVVIADDSSLENVAFQRKATIYQTKDLEAVTPTLRVGTADSEASVSFGTVTSGKAAYVFSDYPIRVRFNGASATQLTLNTSGVPVTNQGAPLPAQCFAGGNFNVTSIYVQPITGATQTANVWIAVTGDPTNDYT